ncbi:hypothetical protein [Halobiforma nitratireducens]|uniref:Uncharacterized protein n=1 Tax=Halobiforma nitratireducens JCM 10879 TaxID=1227454 RepID=M0M7S6_9EURY|nr:hypothetical protein [Halobiforma nitratireducens]EMA41867.1 hypothetical protein C446_04640 [Halobiforma nitratireducens JCM 10879]
MSTPSESQPTAHDIANRLVFHLFLIGFLAIVLSFIAFMIATPFGPLRYVVVVIVNVPVLWLVVHAVVDAVDDLLGVKLESFAEKHS